MDAPFRVFYHSPIGWLSIEGTDRAVTGLHFVAGKARRETTPTPVLREAVAQIEAYFLGRRTKFDLELLPRGTDFQGEVWGALLKVPFGRTASYKDIAAAVSRPDAVRAVGAANGANPISIIIPCHRIIGSNGKLTGYGGGLWRKEWLLAHEQAGNGPLFA